MRNKSDNISGTTIALHGEKVPLSERLKDQRVLLLILIIGMVIIVGLLNPRFVGIKNIVTILQQISVGGLLTMGMAMLMLSGGIDLSVGNIMVLSGCAMSVLLTGGKETISSITDDPSASVNAAQGFTSVPVAIIIGIAISIGCGVLNGVIISKSKCMPLIISLGMSSIYYGLALVITGGKYMAFKMAFEPLRMLKIGEIIPVTMLIFLALVFLAYILVNRTKYGRRIVAIGGNEENARLSGIQVDKYKIITYTISGLYCGIAAILFVARLDAITAGSGAGYELAALTGAVVGGITFDGGKGTIIGAFFGVLFMGLVANAMNVLGVKPEIQTIVQGIIVVAAVIISNIENIRKSK